MADQCASLSELIASARAGDREAASALFTLVYSELRRITLRRSARPAEAVSMYLQAIRINETLSSRDPASVQARRDLAGLEETLGDAYVAILQAAPRKSGADMKASACQAYDRSLALFTALTEPADRTPSLLERRKQLQAKVAGCHPNAG